KPARMGAGGRAPRDPLTPEGDRTGRPRAADQDRSEVLDSRSAPRGAPHRALKFWDSSALVSIVVEEPRTQALRTMREEDPEQTVWCLSEVEIAAALARREREGLGA